MSVSKPSINVQDGFLFHILKAGTPIAVELVNGRRVEGVLKRFDRFALIVAQQEHELLVYKHAVATVEVRPEPS